MVRPVLVLLLLVITAAAVWLARSGVAHWRHQAAGRAYGLESDSKRTLAHCGSAFAAGLCAFALAVQLTAGARHGAHDRTRTAVAAAPAAAVAGQPRTPAWQLPAWQLPTWPARQPRHQPNSEPDPARTTGSDRAPQPVPGPRGAEQEFSVLARPGGGVLLQGALPTADGSLRPVRIWLPPQYMSGGRAGFPVAVLQTANPGRTADAEVPYVFDAFAEAARLARSAPFVVVAPQALSGTARPCDLLAAAPEAVPDDAVLRSAVAARFRTLPPGPQGWATLGVDDAAPCAAAAGLLRPDLYGAAAAVSGRYRADTLLQSVGEARPGPAAPHLLLAAARRDAEGRKSLRGLRDALRDVLAPADAVAGARPRVRTSEVVRDVVAVRERLRLVRAAAQYLAQTLPATGRN
jgi:hypothetical protein